MTIETVGRFEGEDVGLVRLENANGMAAEIMAWGGVLRRLVLPLATGPREVVLGFEDFDDYPAKSPYCGAMVGRFANRIGQARFTLDGVTYALDANQGGVHHLHGGSRGFGRRLWRMDAADAPRSLRLDLTSEDGDQGYPGKLEARCVYSLSDDNILRIEMTATTTQATPVNLAHHSYWNLAGGGTIDAHKLEVEAEHYLPTGEGQIPTGEIRPLAGSALDFRQPRRLDHAGPPEIDFCYVLTEKPGLRRVARLEAPEGDVAMTLFADQPGVQVYSAFKLDLEDSRGRHIGPRSGLCLETEAFPDAPNQPHFPSAILRANETYRHVMEHRFAWR